MFSFKGDSDYKAPKAASQSTPKGKKKRKATGSALKGSKRAKK
jgi:hypothetical protein